MVNEQLKLGLRARPRLVVQSLALPRREAKFVEAAPADREALFGHSRQATRTHKKPRRSPQVR